MDGEQFTVPNTQLEQREYTNKTIQDSTTEVDIYTKLTRHHT